MPYDADLANRVRELLADEDAVTELRMFGGLAFLLKGHLALAVSARGGLMLRLGADGATQALTRPHTAHVHMGGRPMTGWIRVQAEGLQTQRQLTPWVQKAVTFTQALPARTQKQKPRS